MKDDISVLSGLVRWTDYVIRAGDRTLSIQRFYPIILIHSIYLILVFVGKITELHSIDLSLLIGNLPARTLYRIVINYNVNMHYGQDKSTGRMKKSSSTS